MWSDTNALDQSRVWKLEFTLNFFSLNDAQDATLSDRVVKFNLKYRVLVKRPVWNYNFFKTCIAIDTFMCALIDTTTCSPWVQIEWRREHWVQFPFLRINNTVHLTRWINQAVKYDPKTDSLSARNHLLSSKFHHLLQKWHCTLLAVKLAASAKMHLIQRRAINVQSPLHIW